MRVNNMASAGSIAWSTTKTGLAAVGVAVAIVSGDKIRVVRSIGGLITQLWSDVNVGMCWTPYVEVPGLGDVYALPAGASTGDTSYIFYQGTDNTLYMAYETNIPSISYPPQVIPGSVSLNTTTGPTAVMFNGSLYVFYGGTSGDGSMQLVYNVFDGTSWGPATLVVNHATLVNGTMAAPVVLTDPVTNLQTLFLVYVSPGVEANTYQLGYSWSSTGAANTWTTANTALPISNYAVGTSPSAVTMTLASDYEWEGPTTAFADIFISCLLPGTDSVCPTYYGSVVGFDSNGFPELETYENLYDFTVPNADMSGSPFALINEQSVYEITLVYKGSSEGQIFYNWVNNNDTWNGNTQVPNALINPNGSPSAAFFSPEAFSGQMAQESDLYFCFPNQDGDALVVGGLSQFNAGETPSQVVSCPTGSSIVGNFLLPVSFSDTQTPQPWVFYQVVNPPSTDLATASASPSSSLYYSVFTENGWVQSVVPTTVTAPTNAPTGSPAVIAPRPNVPYMVSRTTDDQLAYSYYSQFYNSWSWPTPILGLTSDEGSPSLAMFNDLLYLFYIQLGNLWCTTSSNGGLDWSAGTAVPTESTITGLSSTVFDGALYVFYSTNEDASGMSQLWYTCLSGTPALWGNPTQVIPVECSSSDGILSGAPAACTYTDNQGDELLTVLYAGVGSANNWQLAGCALQASGVWSQYSLPEITIAAPPSIYCVGEAMNVFYQAANTPGQLNYLVYDGFAWSQPGTLPVSDMTGSSANIMMQPSGSDAPSLFILYNSSNANGGETSYGQCTSPVQITGVEAVSPANRMTGVPAATVLNDTMWVFYLDGPGGAAGALSYQCCSIPQTPTLANPQPSWTPSWTEPALIQVIGNAGPPCAVTFDSNIYVFCFTDILCCSTRYDSQWSTFQVLIDGAPITDAGTPSAVVCNGTIYVFYTVSGALRCITSTDTANWSICQTAYITTSDDYVPAVVFNDIIYLFYQTSEGYFYTPFSATEAAQPIQIGLFEMSSGPSIVPFNDTLWALTQGGSIADRTLPCLEALQDNAPVVNGNQQVWYAIKAGSLWSWNTLLADTAIDASTVPAGAVFPPEGLASSEPGASSLFAFYQNDGQISYRQTTGGYQDWTPAQQLNPQGMKPGTAFASCSPSAVSFASSSSSAVSSTISESPQLWLFFQGANNCGQLWCTTYASEASGWSPLTQVVPTGCSASTALMVQSPSAVVYPLPEYATASMPSQLYVFYGVSAGAANPTQALLRYSVSALGDEWSQSEVNISYTWPTTYAPTQTAQGYLEQVSPCAVVFKNTLYVFYTSGYGPSAYFETNTNSYFAYSTFNGVDWSSINFPDINGGQCSGYMYYISACVLDGVLYAYFQNNQDPTAVWSTQTSDGINWTTAAPVVQSELISSGTAMQVSKEANSITGSVLSMFNYLAIPGNVKHS
jgi:hypothetical protein